MTDRCVVHLNRGSPELGFGIFCRLTGITLGRQFEVSGFDALRCAIERFVMQVRIPEGYACLIVDRVFLNKILTFTTHRHPWAEFEQIDLALLQQKLDRGTGGRH